MPLNERSRKNLNGVHPDLVAVVERAAEREPFLVTEGLRTLERQKTLVRSKKSKTLNSRHLTGHAVDLCDPDGCYDIPDMRAIAKAMKASAIELDIPLEWGGDWKTFVDTPHFQLPWKEYPDKGVGVVSRVAEAVKSKPIIVPAAGGTGAAVTETVSNGLPAPPDIGVLTAWRGTGDSLLALGTWAAARPVFTGCLALWILAMWKFDTVSGWFRKVLGGSA